ncbi:MAG: arabinan endo,5-alpha-L-arabinosidase, partial [Phycisphaerales bacterium]|nr:arabinan endo,5-alpha-L-arabinosidase [Phycisphaerales bacterium]
MAGWVIYRRAGRAFFPPKLRPAFELRSKVQSKMARSKSTSFSALTAVLSTAAVAAAQATAPSTDHWTATHDPAIIKQGDTYYLFSTGRGLPMHTSKDLIHWTRVGEAFEKMPAWAAEPFPKTRDMWAPDIVFVDGVYRLYYTVSEFGTSHSAIGLATNTTLDRRDAAYRWADQGIVVSTEKGNDWNAIDSAAFVDQGGQHWMAIGSYWSGLKLFKLDGATGKVIAG